MTVSTATTVFGLQSGAALATVVGGLVHLRMVLLVMKIAHATTPWYETGKRH